MINRQKSAAVGLPGKKAGRWHGLAWLVAATALAAPGHSMAGALADCIWASVPIANRDRFFAGYEDNGSDGANRVSLNPDAVKAAACFRTYPQNASEAGDLGRRMGRLLAVTSLERASANYLKIRGFGQAKLDAGWNSLGPTRRDAVRAAVEAYMEQRPFDTKLMANAVLDAADVAGWGADDSRPLTMPFSDYFTYRAMRESWEAR